MFPGLSRVADLAGCLSRPPRYSRCGFEHRSSIGKKLQYGHLQDLFAETEATKYSHSVLRGFYSSLRAHSALERDTSTGSARSLGLNGPFARGASRADQSVQPGKFVTRLLHTRD